MKQYRATISAGRYPVDFTVEASDWPTAASRAIKLWKKRFKGERTDSLKIHIVQAPRYTSPTGQAGYFDLRTGEMHIPSPN
jgi:hypothetical protein